MPLNKQPGLVTMDGFAGDMTSRFSAIFHSLSKEREKPTSFWPRKNDSVSPMIAAPPNGLANLMVSTFSPFFIQPSGIMASTGAGYWKYPNSLPFQYK